MAITYAGTDGTTNRQPKRPAPVSYALRKMYRLDAVSLPDLGQWENSFEYVGTWSESIRIPNGEDTQANP
jgi:hypothetical protein